MVVFVPQSYDFLLSLQIFRRVFLRSFSKFVVFCRFLCIFAAVFRTSFVPCFPRDVLSGYSDSYH